MSWKAINRILGRACIDQAYWRALQRNPLTTLAEEGFELTSEEKAVFQEFVQLPFPEFCRQLLEELEPDGRY